MTIIEFSAENVRGLRAVHIQADGNTVTLAGGNGQGKSSVLDAITLTLAGGNADDIPEVIRHGEDKAETELVFEHFTVTKTWTSGGKPKLKVRTSDGASIGNPQTFLNNLLGSIAFNPVLFSTLPDKDQYAILLGIVELPFDLDELNARRKHLYDERHDIGRDVTRLEGVLAKVPKPGGDLGEEVSATEIVEELRCAEEQFRVFASVNEDIDQLVGKIAALKEALAEAELALTASRATRSEIGELPDIKEIEARLATVEETNAHIRTTKIIADTWREYEEYKSAQDALTAELQAIDEQKKDGLASVAMPIDGLGFTDQGVVTYKGVPLRQCSSAERIRVSMAVGMAKDPKIRLMCVPDASLLDSTTLALVKAEAEQHNYQLWLEKIEPGDDDCIIIEDGSVKEAPSIW